MRTPDAEAGWLYEVAGVRPLPERVLLKVVGDDAATWINGQVTQDVRALTPGSSAYGLVLHVRGKILSDVHVLNRGARGLALLTARANLEAVMAHLDHHVIMEDVALEADAETAVLTVQGPRAAEVVASVPALESYAADRLGRGGFDVLVASDAVARVQASLVEAAEALGGGAVSEEGWTLARLRAGWPALFSDFGESTYPQEAGLTARAVSFTKGCYLGQEVICMLENRGQLSRRLVQLDAQGALAPGASLFDAQGGLVGEVTSAVSDGEGRTRALGFAKRALAVPGAALHGGSPGADGVAVQVVAPVGA